MHYICFKVLSPYIYLQYKYLSGSPTGNWGVRLEVRGMRGCWGFYYLKYFILLLF